MSSDVPTLSTFLIQNTNGNQNNNPILRTSSDVSTVSTVVDNTVQGPTINTAETDDVQQEEYGSSLNQYITLDGSFLGQPLSSGTIFVIILLCLYCVL